MLYSRLLPLDLTPDLGNVAQGADLKAARYWYILNLVFATILHVLVPKYRYCEAATPVAFLQSLRFDIHPASKLKTRRLPQSERHTHFHEG